MAKPKNGVTKRTKLNAWEKIFQVLMSGKPVEKAYFEKMLGPVAYKISAYVLEIRIQTDATIRVLKDGRKVVSYQLMNPESANIVDYWKQRGIKPDTTIKQLSDLNADAIEPADIEDSVNETEDA